MRLRIWKLLLRHLSNLQNHGHYIGGSGVGLHFFILLSCVSLFHLLFLIVLQRLHWIHWRSPRGTVALHRRWTNMGGFFTGLLLGILYCDIEGVMDFGFSSISALFGLDLTIESELYTNQKSFHFRFKIIYYKSRK